MKTWTIGKRITIGFALLTLVSIAIGVTSFVSMTMLKRDASIMVNNCMPGVTIMAHIKDSVSQQYGYFERLIRTSDPSEEARLMEQFNGLFSDATELYKHYEGLIISEKNRDNYQRAMVARANYRKCVDELFKRINANDTAAAYQYLNTDFLEAYRVYRGILAECVNFNETRSNEFGEGIENIISKSVIVVIVAIFAGIILSVAVAILIIRGTNKVLGAAITSIDDGSAQVASAASQVSSASNMLAEGASEQAASLEETSSSLEEMSSMTAHNAMSAQEAKKVADEMRAAADSSAEQMKQMQAAMDAIKESSTGISQIIKTIDEIAFQTNILALNAAVEAARAGEAGAGFAVVAGEVRNLAQRSAESAKETSAKIEGAIRNSDHGVAISAKVAESLNEIVEKARKMNGLVAEIASASQEQDKGIGQLTTAVQQMDKVTQSNASNAEETASASEELNAHADLLKETVVELLSLVKNDAERREAASLAARAAKTARTGVNVGKAPVGEVRTKVLNAVHSTKETKADRKQRFLTMNETESKEG
jgi:methyl-accepting chemotaxis protein